MAGTLNMSVTDAGSNSLFMSRIHIGRYKGRNNLNLLYGPRIFFSMDLKQEIKNLIHVKAMLRDEHTVLDLINKINQILFRT